MCGSANHKVTTAASHAADLMLVPQVKQEITDFLDDNTLYETVSYLRNNIEASPLEHISSILTLIYSLNMV